MGLEVSTYISGLTPSWPPSGDPKSQGDDHLRLLKSVLQNTFPNASGPVYFPKGEASAVTMVLDITDQHNIISITTTGGDIAVTLPSGFTTTNAGWACEIMKTSADTNGVMVSPASGTISSRVGNTATIRVGALNEPARFIWTGATWVCVKPGAPIGVTQNFDGAIPYGYMTLDGSTYSSTTFAELFAAYGSTTLRDKRGRVEAGVDGGAGRLTNSANGFGVAATLGAVGGLEWNILTAAKLPSTGLSVSGTTGNDAPDHTHGYTAPNLSTFVGLQGGSTYPSVALGGGSATSNGASVRHQHSFSATLAGGTDTPHPNIPPTIISNKAIRAC